MTHRTFRSLDEPPKLIGFSVGQWAALIAGAFALLGLVHIASLPTKAAITLAVFALGLPAAMSYVSESGGLQIGALLRDAVSWRLAPKRLLADSGHTGPAAGILVLGDRNVGGEQRRRLRGPRHGSRTSGTGGR
jgi:hypothetical protein